MEKPKEGEEVRRNKIDQSNKYGAMYLLPCPIHSFKVSYYPVTVGKLF